MAAYGPWLTSLLDDYTTGKTFKALLVDDTYTQNIDTHAVRTSISGEVSGTGYTAGGVLVSGVSVTYDSATDSVVFTCSNVAFGPIDVETIAGIVFYENTGSAATDVLIVADLWDPVEVTDALGFTYRPHADGLIVATIGEAP